jgi:hypothetical protein
MTATARTTRRAERSRPKPKPHGLGRSLRDNGLSLALLSLFLVSLVGHLFAGRGVAREEARSHGESGPAGLLEYAASPHFLESLFENWESEFLQMAAYVVLTIFLFPRGSAESKDPDDTEPDPSEEDPREHASDPRAPWPVRRKGLVLSLYSHSLSISLALLFAFSFGMHLLAGARHFSAERLQRGESAAGLLDYLASSTFWFESFQNWQSEFLSVGALVLLSIFLRQRGSPESKPVHMPHAHTGKD